MISMKNKQPWSKYMSEWALLLRMALELLKKSRAITSRPTKTDHSTQIKKHSHNISICDKQKYVFRRSTLSGDEIQTINNAMEANPDLKAEIETLLKNKILHELEHSMDEINE